MRTGEAVKRLEAVGILRQRNLGRQRYRVFEAPDVIDLFTGLERALAAPAATRRPIHSRAACRGVSQVRR